MLRVIAGRVPVIVEYKFTDNAAWGERADELMEKGDQLLQAYEDLDAQPVQGENIISSKIEIEKTIDTLNVAFEKLLDDLFQDTAWDVSSDISVLNTMLAQEGLTEDEIRK